MTETWRFSYQICTWCPNNYSLSVHVKLLIHTRGRISLQGNKMQEVIIGVPAMRELLTARVKCWMENNMWQYVLVFFGGRLLIPKMTMRILQILLKPFLPRDAMRKRSTGCRPVSVCLSVRPSVMLVYCIHTAKDTVRLFLDQVAPSF